MLYVCAVVLCLVVGHVVVGCFVFVDIVVWRGDVVSSLSSWLFEVVAVKCRCYNVAFVACVTN